MLLNEFLDFGKAKFLSILNMDKFPDRKWQLYANLDHIEGEGY